MDYTVVLVVSLVALVIAWAMYSTKEGWLVVLAAIIAFMVFFILKAAYAEVGSQFTPVEKATYPVSYRLMANGRFDGSVSLLEGGDHPTYATAAHCVLNFISHKPMAAKWTAEHPDLKEPIPLTLEKYDFLKDVAILRSTVPNTGKPLRLFTLENSFEDALFMWGNSDVYNWQLLKGEYLARVRFLVPEMYGPNYRDWYLNTVPSQPGCSGGPVFTSHGEVMGIIWGHITFSANGTDLCVITPADYVLSVWKDKLVQQVTPSFLIQPTHAEMH